MKSHIHTHLPSFLSHRSHVYIDGFSPGFLLLKCVVGLSSFSPSNSISTFSL